MLQIKATHRAGPANAAPNGCERINGGQETPRGKTRQGWLTAVGGVTGGQPYPAYDGSIHATKTGRATHETRILVNPRMMWACPATEQARLHFVEGQGKHWPKLPYEGDVLTLPFIQDPATRLPVPVRVIQIQKREDSIGHLMVVVVMRADQGH